ncbi:MAG: bifunctional methylenetetrahydrofolate dehydrogenase/methenyltetrahydrofolate cyclohydrolase FolD [Wenzhouxiangellaceae bacterium]
MTAYLDGKKLSQTILDQIADTVADHRANGGRAPGLAVILVGADAASQVYVRNKRLACERAGFESYDFDLPADVAEADLLALIDRLNHDARVDGILVQLPLPPHIRSVPVINRIAAEKDVDGFHAANVGSLALRQPGLRPCTPRGVMTLLHHHGVETKGRHAVVVGASNIVGRPMALELLLDGATVTICHRFTRHLERHVRMAEILVVAVGKQGVVDSNWIEPGAVVVDIGLHRDPDGRLQGDLDHTLADTRAAWITPVPGGVGPMTVATLMQNTLEAAGLELHLQ